MEPTEEIQIKAKILDSKRAQFIVDRRVAREGSGALQWHRLADAKAHPLAEMIFGIEGVTGVMIAENVVTVSEEGGAPDWRPIGKQIGRAIRAYLGSDAISRGIEPTSEAEPTPVDSSVTERIQHVLATEINPSVAAHGGHVRLIHVRGDTATVEFSGGCQGCGMATATLKQGVERTICERVPAITRVVDVTDHAAGHSPYSARR